jgi:hypothetical protein
VLRSTSWKYWGWLTAKLLAVALVNRILVAGFFILMPPASAKGLRFTTPRFGYELGWTSVMMAVTVFTFILAFLAFREQKYRCRVCGHALRMPVATGDWGRATLFAPPHTEYICKFGHGTLAMREVQITGPEPPKWRQHNDNIWEELKELSKR